MGKKVGVLGGGYVGCETSMFLAAKGIDVTFVFRSVELALPEYWEIKKATPGQI